MKNCGERWRGAWKMWPRFRARLRTTRIVSIVILASSGLLRGEVAMRFSSEMLRGAVLAGLLLVGTGQTTPAAAAAQACLGGDRLSDVQDYAILDADGGKAGGIHVVRSGFSFDVRWDFRDNGRGNETHEIIQLGQDGRPVDWRIETKSDLGGDGAGSPGSAVSTYRVGNGQAEWTAGGSRQSRAVSVHPLLAPPNASAWAMGVFVCALLQAPGMTLPTIPDGAMKLENLGGEVIDGKAVTAYALHGPGDRIETVRLDASGDLVAVGDGRVVRTGDEVMAAAIREGVRAREEAAAEARQARLVHVFNGPVRIRDVRIFDPASGTLGAPVSVVFFHDKITAVEPLSRPDESGETLIDGQGGTLVPGLHDTHYHLSLSGPEGAWLSLAAGVTTARDMGSNNAYLQHYLGEVAAGRLPGPRIIPSGFIEGESPFSAKSTGFLVNSQDDALKAVRWYAERGYWQVKIYNSTNPAWVPAIAREAHALGLRVAGHIPAFTTPDAMIAAGYDEMTHANQLMLGWVLKPGEDTRSPLRLTAMSRFANLDLNSAAVRKTLEAMQAKHIAFEPTLAIMRRLLTNRTGQVEPQDEWWFSHLPKPFHPGHMVTVMPGFTIMPIRSPAEDAAYNGAAAKMLELVRAMKSRGIFMVTGSDDNNGFVIQRELELFVDAGFSPAEVLRRATLETAQYLGHGSEWGSISRGKSADFFLIPGDPVVDIRAIHSVRMTVAQGRVYFPSEIYRSLGVKPFVDAPSITAK
jgi:hypothetical protein